MLSGVSKRSISNGLHNPKKEIDQGNAKGVKQSAMGKTGDSCALCTSHNTYQRLVEARNCRRHAHERRYATLVVTREAKSDRASDHSTPQRCAEANEVVLILTPGT
jgi:hypothetical protein